MFKVNELKTADIGSVTGKLVPDNGGVVSVVVSINGMQMNLPQEQVKSLADMLNKLQRLMERCTLKPHESLFVKDGVYYFALGAAVDPTMPEV